MRRTVRRTGADMVFGSKDPNEGTGRRLGPRRKTDDRMYELVWLL